MERRQTVEMIKYLSNRLAQMPVINFQNVERKVIVLERKSGLYLIISTY